MNGEKAMLPYQLVISIRSGVEERNLIERKYGICPFKLLQNIVPAAHRPLANRKLLTMYIPDSTKLMINRCQ